MKSILEQVDWKMSQSMPNYGSEPIKQWWSEIQSHFSHPNMNVHWFFSEMKYKIESFQIVSFHSRNWTCHVKHESLLQLSASSSLTLHCNIHLHFPLPPISIKLPRWFLAVMNCSSLCSEDIPSLLLNRDLFPVKMKQQWYTSKWRGRVTWRGDIFGGVPWQLVEFLNLTHAVGVALENNCGWCPQRLCYNGRKGIDCLGVWMRLFMRSSEQNWTFCN